MTRRTFRRIGLALLGAAVACADPGAPGGAALTDGTPSMGGTSAPVVVAMTDTAPQLETYAAAFWAVQGQRTTFRLHYLAPEQDSAGDGELQKHLVVTIPAFTQIVRPDGTCLSEGDSLSISVTVDGSDLAVELGPDGTAFTGDPLHLSLWLDYADLRPGLDAQSLRIWYRPPDSDDWEPQPTRVIAAGKALLADLRHFSNYAVAY
ncbi:MAG: hypothetical protein OER21_09370 [Gemmatimonadota bacterium]|nr:hypothetical protein [Gemmatimonadota bacterium]